ncbi:MAG: T9SS type A sorting domain-containing protein, partial [Saprospiraceae bacterium]|nr:T9SS type A sorting domain-containing protein [Saprospiraceae bacterium]
LEMSLSWEAHTEITVALFDAQGRQLHVLWHGPLSAQRQTLRFEGLDQLEQGVYFLRVQSREGKVVTSVLINQ